MSSDTFHIQIRKIEGDIVELLCTTSTAGGYSDYAVTRSFVLMALEDGMPYQKTTPLQKRLVELGGGSMPPVWEAAFHREHVGEFIASTELVERSGIIGDENAWRERFDLDDATAERDYPLHRFVLRARVTDPKWLTGLKVGDRWGTTAFDAWWDDPTRPSRTQLAAVERKASRWRRPGAAKKTASEATPAKKMSRETAPRKAAAKKKTTNEAAPKKTAAKKTTSKKAAAKKKTSKKAAAKKTTSEKAAPKKTTKRAAPTKKAVAKKAAAKKAAVKKTSKRSG